jgi:hypothetical protein
MGKSNLARFLIVTAVAVGLGIAMPAEAAKAKRGSPPAGRKTTTKTVSHAKKASGLVKARNGQTTRGLASSRESVNALQSSAFSPSRRPAGAFTGSKEVDKPLQVKGQSRNLSMMLMLKGEKDKIKFGEVRENYRREVRDTSF